MKAYEQYADAIFRHCYFRVYRKDIAEELVHDIFIKTWEYLIKKGTIKNIKAFLYKVANNSIIDYTRKKKESSLEILQEQGFEPHTETACAIESCIEADRLAKAIHTLGDTYRQIAIMRYVDELTPKEIAHITGIPVNTVSVRLTRAKKQLQRTLSL